jgi:hypothetical protein
MTDNERGDGYEIGSYTFCALPNILRQSTYSWSLIESDAALTSYVEQVDRAMARRG